MLSSEHPDKGAPETGPVVESPIATPEARPTWFSTLDWFSTLGATTVLISSVLLIANGTCSQPAGLTARGPLCVGSQLSVQSWLALVGLEFSLLGSFLLPRIAFLAISKLFTRSLISQSGLAAERLLNSSSSAPLRAQVKGNKIFIFRCTLFLLIAAVSILYKFSFVTVDATDTVGIASGKIDGDYTVMGDSDIPRPQSPALHPAEYLLTTNIVDFLMGSRASIAYATNASSPLKASGERTDVIIGPKVNETRVLGVVNGTIESCDALLYMRTIAYPFNPFVAENTTALNDSPIVTEKPYNNGIRIQAVNRNQSDTSEQMAGQFVDISTLSNGSFLAWIGSNVALRPFYLGEAIYDTRVIFSMRYCYGYVAWDKLRGLFQMHEPRDIVCKDQAVDLSTWNQTSDAAYALGLLQTVAAGQQGVRGRAPGSFVDVLPILTMLQSGYHYKIKESFKPSIPRNPRCNEFTEGPFAVATGIIRQNRTGMTGVGLGLQALVAVAALCGLSVIAWPTLPLLTEWPAQWLHLASGLDRDTMLDVSAGASLGQKAVKSGAVLVLAGDGEHGETDLLLKRMVGG